MTISLLSGSSPNADKSFSRVCSQPVDFCKAFDSVNRDALWCSSVRCGVSISDLFTDVTGVHQGCVLAHTLDAYMDWILGKMSERSSCGALFVNAKIFDLDFTDDATIFVETLDIFLGAL